MESSNNYFSKERHFDNNKRTKTLLDNKGFKVDFGGFFTLMY